MPFMVFLIPPEDLDKIASIDYLKRIGFSLKDAKEAGIEENYVLLCIESDEETLSNVQNILSNYKTLEPEKAEKIRELLRKERETSLEAAGHLFSETL